MDGLTRVQGGAESPKVVNALAARITVRLDRHFEIELRSDVTWTDGRPLEAAHFVGSWKRILERCRKYPQARLLFAIDGAEAFCRKEIPFEKVGIQSPTPSTLRIRLSSPSPFFLHALAHPVTWPRRLDSGIDTTLTLGPFRADPAEPGLYRKNPHYYAKSPGLDGIRFLAVASVQERIGMFRERSVEVVEEIPNSLVGLLQSDLDRVAVPDGTRAYLLVDPRQKPVHALSIRRAFLRNVRRDELLATVKYPLLPLSSWNGEVEKWELPSSEPETLRLPLVGERLQIATGPEEELRTVASALAAQWAESLGVHVEVAPDKPRTSSPFRLVHWKEDWFEPSVPSFVPALALPLYERAKVILKSPGITTPVPNPVGGWSFSLLRWV